MAMALGQAAHRGTWGMVDKLIALTPLMARRLLAAGFEEKRITVRPSWTADPGEPATPGADFLYLGRLEEAKGINLLLEAWRLRKAGAAGDCASLAPGRRRSTFAQWSCSKITCII